MVIEEFAFEFEDKTIKSQILKLGTKEDQAAASKKENHIAIKEGSKYRFKVKFSVNGEIVPVLKFTNVVKSSLKNSEDSLVLGSYGPGATHSFTFPRYGWNEAPAGFMFRGRYQAQMKFTDADNNTHLDVAYGLNITK